MKFIKVVHRIKIVWYCWVDAVEDDHFHHFRVTSVAWASKFLPKPKDKIQ
jgi:hypothetical protein